MELVFISPSYFYLNSTGLWGFVTEEDSPPSGDVVNFTLYPRFIGVFVNTYNISYYTHITKPLSFKTV